MRANHNSKLGVRNLHLMFKALPAEYNKINPNSRESHNKPKHGESKTEKPDSENQRISHTRESK